jgi:hypothetical protein
LTFTTKRFKIQKVKKIVIEKSIYGGMLVDKYYLHIEGEQWPIQVSSEEWDKYKIGDEYPKSSKRKP